MSASGRKQTCPLTTQSGLLVSFAAKSDEALAMLHEVLERLSVKIESTDRLQSPDQASPIQTSIPRTCGSDNREPFTHIVCVSISHAEDMFTSPSRYGVNNQRHSKLVSQVQECGDSHCFQQSVFRDAVFASQSEKPPQAQRQRSGKPLNRATRAFVAPLAPTTIKLSAYVIASPKLSNAPDNRDEEPLMIAAKTIIRKVAVLITRTIIRIRRCFACNTATSIWPWQQLSLIDRDSMFGGFTYCNTKR